MDRLKLKPCPFCGGEAKRWSCDRLILIGCATCNYKRSFHGLVQSEIETACPVRYRDGTVSDHEWYDGLAHEKAAEAWNRRVSKEESPDA